MMSGIDTSPPKEKGGAPRRKSDREIVGAIRSLNAGDVPQASTKNICDEVGYERAGMIDRLDSLKEDEYVEKSFVGNSALWSLTEKAKEELGAEA